YGVHYMYSYTNVVSDNLVVNSRIGYALMQSKFLTVENNLSFNSNNHGLLLNFITKSTIKNNYITGVRQRQNPQAIGAEGKALFIYNSLFNTIEGNWFARSQIGIHLTAGSEDNKIIGNSFINNPIQVKYVSSRDQNWNGNYWSNYLGWDSNGDGLGDVTFEPNDGVDKMLWQYPEAKLLMNSPAILTLRWVQREFPVLKPSGIRDHSPLMTSYFKATKKQALAIKQFESKS
ncbi:MAG: copper-binding protein, partial [Gammaproteobacteria bacterium]|nr:copper-binding protein [Gammaproteobacteria bacterium]